MSETKAFILLFAGVALFVSVATVVVALTHASGTIYGLAIGLDIALGGWLAGDIVVRYAKIEERKKREEAILSR
jgi:uncharacterized membrane protein